MSLEATEKECAADATAPRVSLKDIEAAIARRYETTADKIAMVRRLPAGTPITEGMLVGEPQPIGTGTPDAALSLLSICILVMRNGFTIIGKSAPASAENFNAELGKKLAYEDAIRQVWPLMGFALRDALAFNDHDVVTVCGQAFSTGRRLGA